MSRIIIGVHGLGNKPPANVLENWWRKSIEEGFRIVSGNMPHFEFKMVYWAHLLHEKPLDLNITDPKDPLFIEDPYAPFDRDIRPEKTGDFRKRVTDIVRNQLENIFMREDNTINFSSVSDFIIQHFFRDLGIYYQTYHSGVDTSDVQQKEKMRTCLADELRKHRRRKILLIAHSMGAIIAYDVLTQMVPDIKIDTFVTIGAPLGLSVIRSKIASEQAYKSGSANRLATPENVTRHWYNLADSRDRIALYNQLEKYYSPNAAEVKVIDIPVENDYSYQGERNPHKSYGYLRTPDLIGLIETFYQRELPFFLKAFYSTIKSGFKRETVSQPRVPL